MVHDLELDRIGCKNLALLITSNENTSEVFYFIETYFFPMKNKANNVFPTYLWGINAIYVKGSAIEIKK